MSQKEQVLKYLKEHESITSIQAFKKFNVTRLSSIIFNLREEGYDITTEYRKGKNRGVYGAYWLNK